MTGSENLVRIRSDPMRLHEIISFKFKKNHESKLGIASFEYDYFPDQAKVRYVKVEYSDKEIQESIENYPNVMRNIDSHIREKLMGLEFGLKSSTNEKQSGLLCMFA
ncbi:MAG: hypothetical protein M3530_00240 [Thermoproteota archaeon]|nr:hypothetical protein [Thermoproteota archaeon]